MKTGTEKVDLAAPVWRLEEIACYLRLPSVRNAYQVVREPGFPASIVHGHRNRRWFAEEVKNHFANHRVKQPEPSTNLMPMEPRVVRKSGGTRIA